MVAHLFSYFRGYGVLVGGDGSLGTELLQQTISQ
jgi:hypothetical protein